MRISGDSRELLGFTGDVSPYPINNRASEKASFNSVFVKTALAHHGALSYVLRVFWTNELNGTMPFLWKKSRHIGMDLCTRISEPISGILNVLCIKCSISATPFFTPQASHINHNEFNKFIDIILILLIS